MHEYQKSTDEVHVVELKSEIVHANWRYKKGSAGDKVSFEIYTHFVGTGSDIEVKVQDKSGKTVGNAKGKVYGDYYGDSIVISDKAKEALVFTAKLSKHGLEKKSGVLEIVPPFNVTNLKWGQKEARRGDVVKMTADTEGIPDDTKVMLCIYEYDQDEAHDFITKFPVKVKSNKIEAEWEYEYHEDTDEIPTKEEKEKYGKNYNPPEYFFVIDVYRQRFGDEQESGLLEFKDWTEIVLEDREGNAVPDEEYVITFADGSEKRGNLDENGFCRFEDVPAGPYDVEFPDIPEE